MAIPDTLPEFISRCMEYVPPEFKGDHPSDVIVLNYLARMEDLHAAFPRMARNAADPYSMSGLIPS